MIKVAEGAFDAISEWFKQHPTAGASLVGGGLGASVGALFPTGDADEELSDRIKRRIRNALILGGMGAGAGALLQQGLDMSSKPLNSNVKKPGDTVSEDVSTAFAHPYVIAGSAAGGAVGGIGVRNLAQQDLRGKVMQVAKAVQGKGNKIAPLSDKATTAQVRSYIRDVLNAVKDDTTGNVPDKVIKTLEKQFGAKGKHLLHELQNYGISTKVLENSKQFKDFPADAATHMVGPKIWRGNGKKIGAGAAAGKARKFMYQTRKLWRRNKWGALGALLAGGASIGISALTGGKSNDGGDDFNE